MFFVIFSYGDGRGKEWLAKNLLMEQKKQAKMLILENIG